MKIIKICGISQTNQALEIAEFGATHIGMIHFEKSPRHISVDKIQEIASVVKGKVKTVAVVVNPDEKTVEKLFDVVDIVQFHGDEEADFVLSFPKERVIKAFRVKDSSDIKKIEPFAKEGINILIDAFSQKAYGGTGKRINPEVAKIIIDTFPKTILSGGLSEENIEEILTKLKPYGVDASSRLEIKPGVKDMQKVKNFIQKAKKFL